MELERNAFAKIKQTKYSCFCLKARDVDNITVTLKDDDDVCKTAGDFKNFTTIGEGEDVYKAVQYFQDFSIIADDDDFHTTVEGVQDFVCRRQICYLLLDRQRRI